MRISSIGRKLLATASIAVAVVSAFALGGCDAFEEPYNPDTDIRILAGSEVEDMQPILDDAEKELGINIRLTSIGTIDGTETVMSGDTDDYDATWFPSNAYMSLFENKNSIIAEEHNIMRSPIVLGIDADKAKQLGWDTQQPTWQQIVDAASSGQFTFGMTSPVSSNSGFSTVIELVTALSGTGASVTEENVDAVKDQLVSFADGQKLTSGSSGWLMDAYDSDPSKVDGVFNYESVIKSDENDLSVVIPQDGVITADYPLSLLNGKTDQVNKNYARLVEYLEHDDVQGKIAEVTNRRTSTTTDGIDAFEIPFPNRIETVRYILQQWVSQVRKPANILFQLDVSGSMAGDRLDNLKSALRSLTASGADAGSVSDSLLTFQPREHVEMVTFSDNVVDRREFDVSETGGLDGLDDFIDDMSSVGGTSIYDVLTEMLTRAGKLRSDDSFTSVVLLTDGENNERMDLRDFEEWYAENSGSVAGIPVYAVAFGEGNRGELERLAEMTGGKVFNADDGNLTSAFKEIRGYL